MKTVQAHGRFFIIGNADEHNNIADKISNDDIVIRFNNPNPTCQLMADWVFIANGTIQIRHLSIEHQFFRPDTEIFFRYKTNDILKSRYENIPINKKLKYCWYFFRWKKKFQLDQYLTHIIPPSVHYECIKLLYPNIFPSTGLLAIYYILQYHPKHKIFLHNFTYQGWKGHNWNKEKALIQTLISEKKLEFI